MALHNRIILNTRPKHQAGELSRLLAEKGAEVIEIPMIDILPLASLLEIKAAIEQGKDTWLIFTSENGVRQVLSHIRTNMRIAVIGKKTAGVLRTYGIEPLFVAREADSEHFASGFLAYLSDIGEKAAKVLLLRGKAANKSLPKLLIHGGLQVAELPVYDSVMPDFSQRQQMLLKACFSGPMCEKEAQSLPPRLCQFGLDILILSSPLGARNLLAASKKLLSSDADWQRRIFETPAAVIGPTTAQEAAKLGWKTLISSAEASAQGMVAAIESYYSENA